MLLMEIYTPAIQVGEIPTVERVMVFGYKLVEEGDAVAGCHERPSSFRMDRIF